MALTADRWTEVVLTDSPEPQAWTEGLASVTIRAGWHDDLVTGLPFLIEQERTVRNQYGTILRRDEERWVYEIVGGPPLEYHRDTYAQAFLPGVGGGAGQPRALRLIEQERTRYYPWTALGAGSDGELTRLRTLAGYVVYDMRPSPAVMTAAQLALAVERGYETDGAALHKIVDSGRPLIEAIGNAEVIETSDTAQLAEWVDPYLSEWDTTISQVDRWLTWTTTKDHIRPGVPDVSGPVDRRKESYSYPLPVPIDPPVVHAQAVGGDGVRLRIEGGGATFPCSFGAATTIRPHRYRLERRVVSETAPSPQADPWSMYDTGGTAPTSSAMVEDDTITEYDGTPAASVLPAQTVYTEPGDAEEVEDDGWVVLATLDNEIAPPEPGQAHHLDDDVENGGVYAYRAVAIIDYDESPYSAEVRATYSGASLAGGFRVSARPGADGAVEIDAVAPDDPGLLDPGYGECLIFDLPIDLGEALESWPIWNEGADDYIDVAEIVAESVAQRIFARDREPGLTVEVEVGLPLICLERGQDIGLGEISWTTTGNGYVISTSTTDDRWQLDGFKLQARRGAGAVEGLTTTITLLEL